MEARPHLESCRGFEWNHDHLDSVDPLRQRDRSHPLRRRTRHPDFVHLAERDRRRNPLRVSAALQRSHAPRADDFNVAGLPQIRQKSLTLLTSSAATSMDVRPISAWLKLARELTFNSLQTNPAKRSMLRIDPNTTMTTLSSGLPSRSPGSWMGSRSGLSRRKIRRPDGSTRPTASRAPRLAFGFRELVSYSTGPRENAHYPFLPPQDLGGRRSGSAR